MDPRRVRARGGAGASRIGSRSGTTSPILVRSAAARPAAAAAGAGPAAVWLLTGLGVGRLGGWVSLPAAGAAGARGRGGPRGAAGRLGPGVVDAPRPGHRRSTAPSGPAASSRARTDRCRRRRRRMAASSSSSVPSARLGGPALRERWGSSSSSSRSRRVCCCAAPAPSRRRPTRCGRLGASRHRAGARASTRPLGGGRSPSARALAGAGDRAPVGPRSPRRGRRPGRPPLRPPAQPPCRPSRASRSLGPGDQLAEGAARSRRDRPPRSRATSRSGSGITAVAAARSAVRARWTSWRTGVLRQPELGGPPRPACAPPRRSAATRRAAGSGSAGKARGAFNGRPCGARPAPRARRSLPASRGSSS